MSFGVVNWSWYIHIQTAAAAEDSDRLLSAATTLLQVTTGELWKLASTVRLLGSMVLSRQGLENIRIDDLAIQ